MSRQYDPELVEKAVKCIQMLAVDAVQAANSGHPGAPMGLADLTFELWTSHLRYDPSQPDWPNRDRFVLSAGHASMLLYGMLHLSGYELSLDQIKKFRQWGSLTPGHPEVHLTPGVETTTGPLGQGISNAVGMALSLKMQAARFNPHEEGLIDARVFGIASDGDLMEGVSAEASSLAGHLGLDNLVFFYDDNAITIDGSTSLTFTEDVGKRYEAYGWFVQRIDGHDHAEIRKALDAAVAEKDRPSLIMAKTHIGKGSPNKQDKSSSHGSPLGPDEVKATKANIGWDHDDPFHVPAEVRSLFADRAEDGMKARKAWDEKVAAFLAKGGKGADLWQAIMGRKVPEDLLAQLVAAAPDKDGATRKQAGVIEQKAAALVPSLVGGSADLAGSNKTTIEGAADIAKGEFAGRNIHFGVREHGMGAIANGMALAGGFIPFTATFLVFSDYMRASIRLAALSHVHCVYVFTHDSVYLGEDGPTHQPVEHYWALRTIPNLDLVRPADATECAAAWTHALTRNDGPTAFALTRQGVPNLERPSDFSPESMLKGGYVIDHAEGTPSAVIVATGSEVSVAVAAKKQLGEHGKGLRIVSMPCLDAFLRQDESYQQEILPPGIRRCSIEVGITQPWRSIVGEDGLTIGHDGFGFSAPAEVIQDQIGLTPEKVAARLSGWLG
jgi:transketolase